MLKYIFFCRCETQTPEPNRTDHSWVISILFPPIDLARDTNWHRSKNSLVSSYQSMPVFSWRNSFKFSIPQMTKWFSLKILFRTLARVSTFSLQSPSIQLFLLDTVPSRHTTLLAVHAWSLTGGEVALQSCLPTTQRLQILWKRSSSSPGGHGELFTLMSILWILSKESQLREIELYYKI